MLIDSHTHFYDEWLLPDADAAVARALTAGVGKMVQADVDSHERDDLWAVNDRYPGVLYPMVGLYPCSVGADWKEEIDKMLPYRERGVVAVGEIGLDYHEGDEDRALQKEALRVQLELASEWDLPVNIHLRDAWGDLLDILEDCRHLHLRGILHCFSGSYEVYERARRAGEFSVGIGGVVTFKKASLAETVRRIPLEHIVLETDAPYLAPVPHRGERNESRLMCFVVDRLAEVYQTTPEEIIAQTTANARRLFFT